MSRIANTFKALKEKNKKALIPYITAGDPHPELTVSMLHALVDAGADMIELGFHFQIRWQMARPFKERVRGL